MWEIRKSSFSGNYEKGTEASSTNNIEESVADAAGEQKNREYRKWNILFHNLEESDSEDIITRIQHDKDLVIEIGNDLEVEVRAENIEKKKKKKNHKTDKTERAWK